MFKINGIHLALISVTGAGLVVAYVLFGPSDKSKRTKKSGFCGLQNLGTTCYLNTLLQSLASCPMFVQWLDRQPISSTVSHTLNKTLKFLTGARYNDDGIFSPTELVTTLTKVGFHFKPHLQGDVHELFVHIFSVIEDEAYKTSCSLADCLEPNDNVTEKKNTHNLIRITNSVQNTHNILKEFKNEGASDIFKVSNEILNISEKSLDKNQNIKPVPFLGYLSNSIECSLCHHKIICVQLENLKKKTEPTSHLGYFSVLGQDNGVECRESYLLDKPLFRKQFSAKQQSSLNYEKFYVVSLNLPDHPQLKIELTTILEQYVKKEKLENLPCSNCEKYNTKTDGNSNIKSVKFGKLPSCLCLHFVRTQYSKDKPLKRKDFVDFPEYLHMDKYTSVYDHLCKLRQSKEKLSSEPIERLRGNKYTFRLKAVIVHVGEHNSGHFSTYRRGITTNHSRHRCSDTRWFFTSDTHIKEVTLQQVLQSVAYMLFYEKCET